MVERKAVTAVRNKNSDKYTGVPKAQKSIKLVIHIPEVVQENTRQQKINRIYDILNPEISQ